ncbi:hypothetical protein ACNSOO_10145 [Aliarcobacter lanthieri]|uniref:hypothetical protein n=1 Tax=Aliarcobacter lanthieri TaxID=1355374 RepID=UPI003AAE5DC3
MNKIVSSILLIGSLSTSLFGDCKVLNFGEPNQIQIKIFGSNEVLKVVDYQAFSSSKLIVYRDLENKFQVKSFSDAYNEFFNYVKENAIKECTSSKYKGISNMDIKYQIDDNYYYFSATLNYLN